MSRTLGIARTIGSYLAIEMFVPGGTLILLAVLLMSRPGSPLQTMIERRCPSFSRLLQRLAWSHSPSVNALAHD
jgi:hypothetical protein